METSNNNSWLQLDPTESISDVLTFDQFVMFEGVLSIARAVISICGIFGNTINIMTFISMGIKDGFSLSMTLLAGIELSHVIVIFMRSVIFGFFIIEYSTQFITWFPVEPFGWPRVSTTVFYDCSHDCIVVLCSMHVCVKGVTL
ncbi:type-1B angiotensin II receptor [Biomphalaria glabrata]|nr:type-1B angiotensin II receptor [Biomphalaria glabrata]